MRLQTPGSTRTDTLLPYTTLFRSRRAQCPLPRERGAHRGSSWAPGRGDDRHQYGRTRHRYPARWQCRFPRSEEHTSELQPLMRISYAVFCLNIQHINISLSDTLPLCTDAIYNLVL